MRRSSISLGIALALLAALALSLAAGGQLTESAGASHTRPNVIVVMTDDQTVADMRVMSQTKALIGDQGTTFENNFVNFPLCCPSRATLFTGQYAHNHGVLNGRGFVDLDSSNTLPLWLQNAGYNTAHVGKYLNGYGDVQQGGRELVPPGWSEWYATLPDDQAVYDYDLNENGSVVHYGSNEADFKGDVITDKALDFIGRRAPASAPFFLSVGYTAPHGVGAEPNTGQACQSSAKPAPRHIGAFDSEPFPKPPSFNEANVSDKHQAVRDLPLIASSRINVMTRQYRCRLASLLHVDEGVADMVAALRDAGELDNTQIIYTSDNGFFFGEHRIHTGKVHVYEEASRVPLLMRGPGVPAGHTARGLSTNADLAPTILEAASVAPGRTQDGMSLLDVVGAGDRPRDILIENHIANPTQAWTPYMAVRTPRYVYVEYSTGEQELFDLQTDPYQLESRHAHPAYRDVRDWLDRRLDELRACAGATCRASAGEPPPPFIAKAPNSATILSGGGSVAGGTSASLASNDDSFFRVNSTNSGTRTTSWQGSFSGVPNTLQDLRVNYSGLNSRPCNQLISIWRWTDSRWVHIDPPSGTRWAGTTELTISNVPVGGTLADYVSGTSGDGEVRVRVMCTRSTDSFVASADFLQIEYEPFAPAPAYTPPQTTIDSGPPGETQNKDASFGFSSNEAGSTFECSLDGAAFTACTSPRDYTGLALGQHEFRVRATDPQGNVDPAPAHYVWKVVPPPCTSATQNQRAEADSWILQDSATSNYGSDSTLKVDTKAGADARALVRFALPSIPSGCQVTDARLRLYASSFKSGRTLEAVRLAGSWTESGVTWATQPSTAGTAATAPSRSGVVEWTVTSQVRNMYSGGNHGFLVRDSIEGGTGLDQQFHSREKGNDNPPVLVIDFG
jgi:N-acetylglucosamine-6-sulfatase